MALQKLLSSNSKLCLVADFTKYVFRKHLHIFNTFSLISIRSLNKYGHLFWLNLKTQALFKKKKTIQQFLLV